MSEKAAPLTPEELAEYRATSAFFVKPTHFDVVKLIATIDARDATIAEQAETIARLQQIEERAKDVLDSRERGNALARSRGAKGRERDGVAYLLRSILEGEKP